MAFKETFVENVPESRLASFQEAGIETFFGQLASKIPIPCKSAMI